MQDGIRPCRLDFFKKIIKCAARLLDRLEYVHIHKWILLDLYCRNNDKNASVHVLFSFLPSTFFLMMFISQQSPEIACHHSALAHFAQLGKDGERTPSLKLGYVSVLRRKLWDCDETNNFIWDFWHPKNFKDIKNTCYQN